MIERLLLFGAFLLTAASERSGERELMVLTLENLAATSSPTG